MLNIHSNSTTESLHTKILDICKNTETANNIYLDVVDTCNKFGADVSKVAEELIKIIDKQPQITSPYNFITKVAYRLVVENKDELKRDHTKPCFLKLHLALKDYGFEGEESEKLLIDLIEDQCFEYAMPTNLMCELNSKIIDYCIKHEMKTYHDFAGLLLKSKPLKDKNIPIDFLKRRAEEMANEFKEIVDYVEVKKCLHLKTMKS